MTKTVWLKASALWLAILVLAILNGILREKGLIPALGSFAGFIASGTLFLHFSHGILCRSLVRSIGSPSMVIGRSVLAPTHIDV